MKKILRKFSLLHLHLVFCAAALSGFSYAGYYGYEIMGSNESSRSAVGGVHSPRGSTIHHK